MCIAIYSLAGNPIPDDKTLKNCFVQNDDGAGFAFNNNGHVEIRKGFMTFDSFIDTLHEYDKLYDLKSRGVLLHFRITTHGGTNKQCCHPFPLTSNDKQLKKTTTSCNYAVIHNGIISLTCDQANKEKNTSDTMVFIRDYLTKISGNKGWFYNQGNFKLIGDLIDSKMAILNGKGEIRSTEGFQKGEDGNYYSNSSYKDSYRYFYDWGFDYTYEFDEYDVEENGYCLMRLKKGECVYYDDGTTEDYDKEYHSDFPTFISAAGNVFACYDGRFIGRTVNANRLTYVGTGIFVDQKKAFENNLKPVPFRNDITVYRFEDSDDLEWMCG